MPEIVFLTGVGPARNDNHRRLPAAFAAAGWQVSILPQEAVRLQNGEVRFGEVDPDRFELIWLVGMGRAETFFDRMQLLRQLPQERFVTCVDAMIYLHAKYAWSRHMPETHASSDAEHLKSLLQRGGEWVAKPPAGSYGRDVVQISAGAAGDAAIEALLHGGRFGLLQRYVPEIRAGEKRTLVAAGRLVGTYLRVPDGDFRANLAAHGQPAPATLTEAERALVDEVAGELVRQGVGFAAVDIAFPWLMEVNLVNPGGLATLAQLYGRDFTPAVVQALDGWGRQAAAPAPPAGAT